MLKKLARHTKTLSTAIEERDGVGGTSRDNNPENNYLKITRVSSAK